MISSNRTALLIKPNEPVTYLPLGIIYNSGGSRIFMVDNRAPQVPTYRKQFRYNSQISLFFVNKKQPRRVVYN